MRQPKKVVADEVNVGIDPAQQFQGTPLTLLPPTTTQCSVNANGSFHAQHLRFN